MHVGRFWDWFSTHEAEYRGLDDAGACPQTRLEAFEAVLHTVDPGLGFEVGTAGDGLHELVISADGDPDAFDSVRRVVAAAPSIPGWRVLAFRQADGEQARVSVEDVEFAAASAWFRHAIVAGDRYPTLQIGHAHFEPARRGLFRYGTDLLLQAMFGEELASECLAAFHVCGVPECPSEAGWQPLSALVDMLDDCDGCGECGAACECTATRLH